MANADAPFGMRAYKHQNGAPYNGAVNPYYITSTGPLLFMGDPVVVSGTANSAAIGQDAGAGFPPGTLPTIIKATAADANAISGVIVGFQALKTDLTVKHSAASGGERIAFVCDDPTVIFLIQESTPGTALVADSVGLNANLIFTHAGSTVTGLSGVELDTSGDQPDTAATNQLTIRRLANVEGNAFGTNAVWEVTINNHSFGYGAVGL